jgi:hypothetical protein
MSIQKAKEALLRIWPRGADCEHVEAQTAFRELDSALQGKVAMVDTLVDCWQQFSLDMGGGWQSDGCLSTLELLADDLVDIGRLERHPERPWFRVKQAHPADVNEEPGRPGVAL